MSRTRSVLRPYIVFWLLRINAHPQGSDLQGLHGLGSSVLVQELDVDGAHHVVGQVVAHIQVLDHPVLSQLLEDVLVKVLCSTFLVRAEGFAEWCWIRVSIWQAALSRVGQARGTNSLAFMSSLLSPHAGPAPHSCPSTSHDHHSLTPLPAKQTTMCQVCHAHSARQQRSRTWHSQYLTHTQHAAPALCRR